MSLLYTRLSTAFYKFLVFQESYFFWTFGVHEEDFFGAIDIDSGKSILFPPRLPPAYGIICGKLAGFQLLFHLGERQFAQLFVFIIPCWLEINQTPLLEFEIFGTYSHH